MKNIVKRVKGNPWRNTRNDKSIPWMDILGAIFMVLLPILIICISSNIVLRSGTFYSFYFSKTAVINEIPYHTSNEELTATFSNFMMHKSNGFKLTENSDYMPQQVFNQRDGQVMESIRGYVDDIALGAILLFVMVAAIYALLYFHKEKKLLYGSYAHSVIWFIVLLAVEASVFLVPFLRELIFKTLFGVRFPLSDVLIILFENQLATYMGIGIILTSIVLMVVVYYFMKTTVSDRKMFRGI